MLHTFKGHIYNEHFLSLVLVGYTFYSTCSACCQS